MTHVFCQLDITFGVGPLWGYTMNLFGSFIAPLSLLTMGGFFMGGTRVEVLVESLAKAVKGEMLGNTGDQYSGLCHFMTAFGCFLASMVIWGTIPMVNSLAISETVVMSLAFSMWATTAFCCFPQGFTNMMSAFAWKSSKPEADSWFMAPAVFLTATTELLILCFRPITLSLRLCTNALIGQVVLGSLNVKVGSWLFLSFLGKPIGVAMFLLMVGAWVVEVGLMVVHTSLFMILLFTYVNEFSASHSFTEGEM